MKDLVKVLVEAEPGPLLWNQYTMDDARYDLPGGSVLRQRNLLSYGQAFKPGIEALVVGEAPGIHGMRASGIAFTSEYQLVNGIIPVRGQRSSAVGPPWKETSATHMWRAMGHLHGRVALWNSLPFLPHKPGKGNELTMRAPTDAEQDKYAYVLEHVVLSLDPALIVAVGRRAEAILTRLKFPHVGVRHPANGGATLFAGGMQKHLGAPPGPLRKLGQKALAVTGLA